MGVPMWMTSYLSRYIYARVYSIIYITNTSVPMFITYIRGIGIIVTLKLISDVLLVPRVEKPDYPGSLVLSSISWDALAFCFCECPSTWAGTFSIVTRGFAQNLGFWTWSWHSYTLFSLVIKPSSKLVPDFFIHY